MITTNDIYKLTELNRTFNRSDASGKRVFFSIYYQVKDNAFSYAAKTWERIVKEQERFDMIKDKFMSFEVRTESDFKKAWQCIAVECSTSGSTVWVGNLLTHASKNEESSNGLEFKPLGSEDGTLTKIEIINLPKLPWSKSGYLLLSGCNTGKIGARGWCPAQEFARTQNILTLGQDGYSYFSNKWANYERADLGAPTCLWAYARSGNNYLGGGSRIKAKVFMANQ